MREEEEEEEEEKECEAVTRFDITNYNVNVIFVYGVAGAQHAA
jgi:hypothetical protein